MRKTNEGIPRPVRMEALQPITKNVLSWESANVRRILE
jgi:hypothetical protein